MLTCKMQLDTLVPFITMAIASSGLAGSAGPGHNLLSPARLVFASGALTAAVTRSASTCVFQIHRVRLVIYLLQSILAKSN